VAQHATACSHSKEAGPAAWPEISLETCSSEFGGGEVWCERWTRSRRAAILMSLTIKN